MVISMEFYTIKSHKNSGYLGRATRRDTRQLSFLYLIIFYSYLKSFLWVLNESIFGNSYSNGDLSF